MDNLTGMHFHSAEADEETAALFRQIVRENQDLRRQLKRYRWVPVTEALPDRRQTVLALNEIRYTYPPAMVRRVIRAFYTPGGVTEVSGDGFDEDDCEWWSYDEERGASYLHEGWYEECAASGYYYHVETPVTHWMPLPPAE